MERMKDFLIAVIVKVKPFLSEENYESHSRKQAGHQATNDSSLQRWHAKCHDLFHLKAHVGKHESNMQTLQTRQLKLTRERDDKTKIIQEL